MYAIRQISTGWFMPQFGKNQSKGGTWLEPTADCVPRLFKQERHAKAALEHWLRGQLSPKFIFDMETGHQEYSQLDYKPVPGRNRRDMEVVPVAIVVERLL